MKRNHGVLLPNGDPVQGIYPIFISYSSTHRLLTFWKDHGGDELRRLLFTPSPQLKKSLILAKFDVVVPIPQNAKRSLKRGHASALEAAKFFSKELGVALSESLIMKETSASKQADLNAWERAYSENAFVSLPINAGKVLLVDDFITTGSTLEKAAHAILKVNPDLQISAAALGWKPKKISASLRDPKRQFFYSGSAASALK